MVDISFVLENLAFNSNFPLIIGFTIVGLVVGIRQYKQRKSFIKDANELGLTKPYTDMQDNPIERRGRVKGYGIEIYKQQGLLGSEKKLDIKLPGHGLPNITIYSGNIYTYQLQEGEEHILVDDLAEFNASYTATGKNTNESRKTIYNTFEELQQITNLKKIEITNNEIKVTINITNNFKTQVEQIIAFVRTLEEQKNTHNTIEGVSDEEKELYTLKKLNTNAINTTLTSQQSDAANTARKVFKIIFIIMISTAILLSPGGFFLMKYFGP